MQLFVCILWCIEKWVGLLKTLTHLVQLWASILSKCLFGALAAVWSPTVKHNSHEIRNISTLGCMARCAWWPCGEWVGTSNLSSSNILCSWIPIYNQTQPDLSPSRHAYYSVLSQLLLPSEGLATVLTVEDSQMVAVLGLVLHHIA